MCLRASDNRCRRTDWLTPAWVAASALDRPSTSRRTSASCCSGSSDRPTHVNQNAMCWWASKTKSGSNAGEYQGLQHVLHSL